MAGQSRAGRAFISEVASPPSSGDTLKRSIKDILLNHAALWERLRERAVG